MNKKTIIILAFLLIIAGSALYFNNGTLFKGMLLQPLPKADPRETSEDALTRGKFITMVASTMMSDRNAQQINSLSNCTPEVKGYKYAVYINFACAKKWQSIKSPEGSLRLRDPITKKEAAAILIEVFSVEGFDELGNDEILSEELGRDWLKTAWKNQRQ